MSVKTVNKTILECFSNLGNKADSKRNESCVALVQQLASSSAPEDATYTLKRLIRGLGATQPLLTKGSFAALVSVLNAFSSTITCKTFLELVDKEYKLSSKDEGDKVGLVLAYGAAIRGGLFSGASSKQQELMLSTLIDCLEKKSYLSSVASPFLQDLVLRSDKSVLVKVIWPVVKEKMLSTSKKFSLDILFLVLSINNKVDNVVQNDFVEKWLGSPLFSSKSIQLYAQKLVAESTAENLNHPIYEELSCGLCSTSNRSLLKTFWTVHVSAVLTVNDYTSDCAALRVFTALLKNLSDKQQIKMLVMPSFVKALVRTLGVPQSDDRSNDAHQIAGEAVTSLKNVLASNDIPDKVVFNVLCTIFLNPHEHQCEELAGLLDAKLSSQLVDQLAKKFKSMIDGIPPTDDYVLTIANRKAALQQLIRLIGHPSCNDETKWKGEQLVFLLDRGLFIQPTPLNSDLAHTLKDSFFSYLDQMFTNQEVMVGILGAVVSHINDKLSSQEELAAVMRIPLSNEAYGSWQKMFKQVSRIEQKNGNKKSAEQIFHLLFLSMGLQLFSDSQLASSALEELHSCYKHMKSGKRSSKSQGEPEWFEVTVDLFLSLLSHDSHLLRTILSKAFPYLAKHLTVSAFCQILEVLDPSQNANPLTSAEDMNGASDDSEYESDDDAPSVKPANGKHKSVEEESSDPEGSDEDEEEEEEEDSGEDDEDFVENDEATVSDKVRQEIMLALGNAASLTDTESVDLDDIDEEEGQRMDAALGAAFRTLIQSKEKKKKKNVMRDHPVTHFRSRVLDLVDIYVSKEPSMEICHECITPLLSLIDFCMKDNSLKGLETKTRNVLHKLTSTKKFSCMDGVSEESVARQIEALAIKGFGNATTFWRLSSLIYECCTYLVRCSELVGASTSEKSLEKSLLVEVYKRLLEDFFTKRKTLLSIDMFKSVLNLRWSGWWCMAPSVVRLAFDPKVLLFRRGQALDLLTHFFRNNPLLGTTNKLAELKKIVGLIVDHTVQFLKTPGQDSRQMQHVPSVLRLIHRILTTSSTKPNNTSALADALTSFCQSSVGMKKDTKRLLRSLPKELGLDPRMLKDIGNIKKNKKGKSLNRRRNGDEVDEEEEEDDDSDNGEEEEDDSDSESVEVSKQKVKHGGLKGKSKKEKKMQRLVSMGEGLDSFVFSNVNSDVINGFEPDDEARSTSDDTSPQPSPSVNLSSKALAKRKPQHSSSGDSHFSKKKKRTH